MSYRTRGEFACAFLPKIDAKDVSDAAFLAMMSWMQAEGDAGRFNPLNTTLWRPGSTVFNSVGVRNYASFGSGVGATASTLNWGARLGKFGYREIRHALRKSHDPAVALQAVENSAWGTGGLALKVYETTPNDTLLALRHHRLAQ